MDSARGDSMTRQRSVSTNSKEAPRSCVACTENLLPLIKACRKCGSEYCVDCLVEMFKAAEEDNSRMPPQCCNIIQLHTVNPLFSSDFLNHYRARLEEWITPNKIYCPSPTCSAFIPERLVPTITATSTDSSLHRTYHETTRQVASTPAPRFFEAKTDLNKLPGNSAVVSHPSQLGTTRERLTAASDASKANLTSNTGLIAGNAQEKLEAGHHISRATRELFKNHFRMPPKTINLTACAASSTNNPDVFACPKCEISICAKCKHVDHAPSSCDMSVEDYEKTILNRFGYKRCPRCKTAVKRMYGCAHIHCLCDAHWCYHCRKSTAECEGSCTSRVNEDDESISTDEDDESASTDEADQEEVQDRPTTLSRHAPPLSAHDDPSPSRPLPDSHEERPINLDGGGRRVWGDHVFNGEPEEFHSTQVWSCRHRFYVYRIPPDHEADAQNTDKSVVTYGNLSLLECNRCSVHIVPSPPSSLPIPSLSSDPVTAKNHRSKKGRLSMGSDHSSPVVPPPADLDSGTHRPSAEAQECLLCGLIVCKSCCFKYITERTKRE